MMFIYFIKYGKYMEGYNLASLIEVRFKKSAKKQKWRNNSTRIVHV